MPPTKPGWASFWKSIASIEPRIYSASSRRRPAASAPNPLNQPEVNMTEKQKLWSRGFVPSTYRECLSSVDIKVPGTFPKGCVTNLELSCYPVTVNVFP